jgi:MoxR-like ATPase
MLRMGGVMDFESGKKIIDNISRVVVGNDDALELLLVALLSGGHVLLEDVPGVGKTLIIKCLSRSISGSFKRIQFTPDLLPSDVTGFNVYDQKNGEFKFQPGPILTNILLADEINRAIPRTQSSLLEGMEERQATIDGKTYPLPMPFFVLATQNPIELEGTFPLPEAQLDRFLLKISLGYPDKAQEMEMLKRFQTDDPFVSLEPVTDLDQIIHMQHLTREIGISTPVREYITDIVAATRGDERLRFGSSPRGSMGLMRAAQGLAALRGRSYVLPDDVKKLVLPVLSHRILLNEERKLSGDSPETILGEIISRTPVPD